MNMEYMPPDIRKLVSARLLSSTDFINQQLKHNGDGLGLAYINSLCDEDKIQKAIIKPFYEIQGTEAFADYLASVGKPVEQASIDEGLLEGKMLVLHQGRHVLYDSRKTMNAQIRDSTVETVLQGPQNGFCENINGNLNLLRNRYPLSSLVVERTTVGTMSKTKLALVYDEQLVDLSVLKDLKKRLEAVQVNVLSAAVQLEKLLTKSKKTLFPTIMTTERPDRASLNLSQGKIIVLVEGAPFALVLPAVFFDFFSTMDDEYQSYWIGRTFLMLRYISLFITLLAPALYIAVISYNPEIFRVQLTMSIAGSRAAVPYPSYMEVIFMLFMTEALTEASIRLPKHIGSTATTVGGLILGQAAQQAGLVSSIMIIITAAVAISNFVIPINTMSMAMRVAKYPIIVLASFGGLVGTVLGFVALLVILTGHRSFGKPYLKLFTGERENLTK